MRFWVATCIVNGCTSGRDGDPTVPGTPTGSEVLDPVCVSNAVIPAVLDCTWTSPTSGVGYVEYWLADAPDAVWSTPSGAEGTEHQLAVLGLKASRIYEFRAVVESGPTRLVSPIRTHTVPDVPADFAALSLTVHDPETSEIAHGYVLMSVVHIQGPSRFTEVVILDGDGDRVWWTRSVDKGLVGTPLLSHDGRSIRYLTTDQTWTTELGAITRVALDGSELQETRTLLGHHASIENSDGTLTWISFDYANVGGRDWAADALRTAPEGVGDEHVPDVEFAWFDDYPEDPWEDVPGLNDEVRWGTGIEWTHTNSLMAIDDQSFYISAKNVDAILKIDRNDGSIVWQLNGMYGDFTHPDGTAVWRSVQDLDLFSHSHMSHLWDGGMVVFDNGDLSHDPPFSRAVEYTFDEDELTVEQTWEYVEPDHQWTGAMGDVRKLDGGNYLIAWSSLEYVNEVTPDGETVWQVEMSDVGTFARVVPMASLYPTVAVRE
jgi:hypothetical protein